MSQAKVEQYKKEKANRKKTIARERRQHFLAVLCGWAVCAAIVVWAGYSGYQYYQANRPVETFYCNTDAINTYISDLSSAE